MKFHDDFQEELIRFTVKSFFCAHPFLIDLLSRGKLKLGVPVDRYQESFLCDKSNGKTIEQLYLPKIPLKFTDLIKQLPSSVIKPIWVQAIVQMRSLGSIISASQNYYKVSQEI